MHLDQIGSQIHFKFIWPKLRRSHHFFPIIYSRNNHGGCIEMAKIPMRPKIGTHNVLKFWNLLNFSKYVCFNPLSIFYKNIFPTPCCILHWRSFGPYFLGFNGWKSNCQFDSWPFLWLQFLIHNSKWRMHDFFHIYALIWCKELLIWTRFTTCTFIPKFWNTFGLPTLKW